ncbi:MAG TPA: amidase [Baekduia sp.]|nr:amidase [Baekduia sp.]
MIDPLAAPATELLAAFRRRTISPVELLDAVAARIAEVDDRLGAFTTLSLDRAREQALTAERAYGPGGSPRLLEGIPLAVKDLIDTADLRTTYGSSMFAEHVPSRDATAAARARAAGAIVVGKTATHEFAWGITTNNPHFGPCRNPWDLERVPGGSSGGSAVAIAGLGIPLALGSDTGGSVRIPAALCGVVGLKPTFGRVSTAGVFPLARSLDHAGVLARTPADAGLLLRAIAGHDPADPATATVAPIRPAPDSVAGLTVGWAPDAGAVDLSPEVAAALDTAAGGLAGLGADIRRVRLPGAAAMEEVFAAIQGAEAHDAHVRAGLFPARRDEYGADVRERLERGADVDVAAYLAAREGRRTIAAAVEDLFDDVDVLLTPVSSGLAARIGEETVVHDGEDVPFRRLVMANTMLQNLTGLPSCAVRAGFDALGLPVGVQVTARAGGEELALTVASALHGLDPELQARRPSLERKVTR